MALKPLEIDPRPLMRQLARMADMEPAPIRRMVLVLDVECVPTLFVETFLNHNEEQLVNTPLAVSDVPVIVSATDIWLGKTQSEQTKTNAYEMLETTSMQNMKYRTFAPKPG